MHVGDGDEAFDLWRGVFALGDGGDVLVGSDDPVAARAAGEGEVGAGREQDGDAVESLNIEFVLNGERQIFVKHGGRGYGLRKA